ncbi:MAG: hypothetical protein NPIRA03_19980 [Nitrospirales bacterium]|nr:MAG: hypothetical protein NPIRA03_19980 [Nitrospirales bacterium]
MNHLAGYLCDQINLRARHRDSLRGHGHTHTLGVDLKDLNLRRFRLESFCLRLGAIGQDKEGGDYAHQ